MFEFIIPKQDSNVVLRLQQGRSHIFYIFFSPYLQWETLTEQPISPDET